MVLPRLWLEPEQGSYGVQYPDDAVLRAKPSAGPSLMRLDFAGAPFQTSIEFRLDFERCAYWAAFYNTTISFGSLPFEVGLIIDDPDIRWHECRIIPGSVSGPQQRGNLYILQMQMEVKPIPRDTVADAALVAAVEASGGTDFTAP